MKRCAASLVDVGVEQRMTDRRTQILDAAARRIARNGVRGMRVNDVAADAGVSPGLLYYHFTDRSGLLNATMAHINSTATMRGSVAAHDAEQSAYGHLLARLLGEIDEDTELRDNSAAWNELRALAVFEPDLRDALAASTRDWNTEIAELVRAAQLAQQLDPSQDADDIAAILTATVEGLSGRWLGGEIDTSTAHRLLTAHLTVLSRSTN